MSVEWYYAHDGQQSGPFSVEEFQRLASDRKLQPDDWVWKVGMADWKPASSVRGLFTTPSPQQPPAKIETTCPSCSKSFRVDEEHLGRKARCSACGTVFVVIAVVDVDRVNASHDEVMNTYLAQQERVMSDPLVGDAFPYAAYEGLADTRQRATHNEMMHQGIPINGKGSNIYRSDDPIWRIWTPPNGKGCRCGKTFMMIRQAARRGVPEAQEWLAKGIPPANPWFTKTTLQPDRGYGERPTKRKK